MFLLLLVLVINQQDAFFLCSCLSSGANRLTHLIIIFLESCRIVLSTSLSNKCFLVGAFLVKSVRLLQWLVFFLFFVRPQTSSRMYHFLQKLIKLLRLLRPSPANANLVQRVPLSFLTFLRNLQNQKRLKCPPFQFFRHCATFFENFLMSQKSPPFELF